MIQKLKTDTLFPFEIFKNSCSFGEGIKNSFLFQKFNFIVENHTDIECKVTDNTYTFCLQRNRFNEQNKSIIIICSKDNANILEFTLKKLDDFEILKQHDVLLVDDRSSTSDILSLSDKYKTSYLRIENSDNSFNYSVINNIAVSYANIYNKELLIFHNNDLWPKDKNSLDNLIRKHFEYKSTISGCKLIYPSKEEYKEIGKPLHVLNDYIEQAYETIQHGGVFFLLRPSVFPDKNRFFGNSNLVLSPSHLWRFYDEDNHIASKDSLTQSVTGAIQIISTKDFISLGGLNIAMSIAFQDIDLCLKAIENNMTINYIGSETMVHAESITNAKEQVTKTIDFSSDHVLWDLLWGVKLPYLLGYVYINKL